MAVNNLSRGQQGNKSNDGLYCLGDDIVYQSKSRLMSGRGHYLFKRNIHSASLSAIIVGTRVTMQTRVSKRLGILYIWSSSKLYLKENKVIK